MTSFTKETGATDVAATFSPQIAGKVVLITGSSPNSLSETAATAIARHNPALLILGGRSPALVQETQKSILSKFPAVKTRLLIFDLASLDSVRKGAAEVNGYSENIDVLINSAGIMAVPFQKTGDGIESQFAVNHLGHFLFTNLIVGKLSKYARIINVTSGGYAFGGVRFDDINFETEQYNKWASYGQSKTANILYSAALAEKLGPKGIFSYSVDVGGGVYTNLARSLVAEDFALLGQQKEPIPIITHDQGTASYIAAAFDPSLEANNGSFVQYCYATKTKDESPWTRGKENADKLWTLSEKLVGQKFDF